MQHSTENPFLLTKIADFEAHSNDHLDQAISRSFTAWHAWRRKTLEERALGLTQIALGLRQKSEALARQMALEIGKPVKDGRAEIEKSAAAFDYIAGNFSRFLKDEPGLDQGSGPHPKAWVAKTSLGPVLSLMPWNYPLWQLIRFAGPGLLSGNTILFKGAMEVLGTSQMIAEIFQSALPPGVFENIIVEHERIERIIADPRIRGVTFTGSVEGGRTVAASAGKHLKKAVMELGGSDPYVLLPDCDIERAARICAATRLVNNGQSCIAGKRFFVHTSQFSVFIDKFKTEMGRFKHGDPLDPETDLGPLASRKHSLNLSRQVEKLREDPGCQFLWEKDFSLRGAQFAPQIWRVQPSVSWVHHEEFFGPVALVFVYEDLETLPDFINQSSFGLGAGVLGKDSVKCRAFATRLEAGMVVINDFLRSDVRAPFGGVKDSGFGRELSQYGLFEFCNIQSFGEPDSVH